MILSVINEEYIYEPGGRISMKLSLPARPAGGRRTLVHHCLERRLIQRFFLFALFPRLLRREKIYVFCFGFSQLKKGGKG